MEKNSCVYQLFRRRILVHTSNTLADHVPFDARVGNIKKHRREHRKENSARRSCFGSVANPLLHLIWKRGARQITRRNPKRGSSTKILAGPFSRPALWMDHSRRTPLRGSVRSTHLGMTSSSGQRHCLHFYSARLRFGSPGDRLVGRLAYAYRHDAVCCCAKTSPW